MRTTLQIDDRVLRAARALADDRGVSLGAAVSLLAARGLDAQRLATLDDEERAFPLLPAPAPGHVITDELVAAHQDDE